MVRFGILGPLEVTDGDRLVDLGGPRQRTLVAMLLVNANRVVSADRLIDSVWGEHPPARVVTGLQVLVSNLRRALEPDRPPRDPPQVLVTRPPGYLLVVETQQLDAARFEALAARGRELLASGQAADAGDALTEAIGLWRGPALAEVADEDFARPEAARLDELATVARENLLQAGLDLGRHAAAVPELEQLVQEHPLRERLWGLLMLAFYRSGRQAEALRTFQQARQRLGEELGIDPSPELQRLEADMLAQASSLDWRPAAAPAPAPAPPPPQPTPSLGLVGRTEQVRRLRAAFDGAASGHGRLVLVSGEAGVGKTRLIDELTRHAAGAGAVVGWGRCHEGHSAPPFWPWAQVLRSATAEAGADLDSFPEAGAAALAQLVPELRERAADTLSVAGAVAAAAPLADAAHARSQLFQALATFLVRLARDRCLVLVVDDLQWADAPSLELLTFLAGQLGDSRILLLGTFRDADVDDDHPLCAVLATLARRPWAERLTLSGIGPGDIGPLISATTGIEAPADLAAAIHARTDGNPFFIIELVRMLDGDGSLAGGDAKAALRAPVPLGVRDVIRQRIAQLAPTARTVLTVAAVAGREFDETLLEAAGADVDEDVLSALELAMARGIVVETPEVVGRYRFSHGLIRETIYEGLSGTRRARLHARVAEALERLPSSSHETRGADLAYHFWHAVPVTGAAKPFRYALDAAHTAVDQLAFERAEDQLQRALTLVPSLPETDRPAAELQALNRLGTLLAAIRGHASAEVRGVFSRACDLCRTGDHEPREQIAARWGLFYSLYVGGDVATAREVAVDLLAAAGPGAVVEAVMAGHLAVGIASFHVGRLGEARDHLDASVDRADEAADPALGGIFQVDPRVYARCFLALVLALTEGAGHAEAVASEARAMATGLAHPIAAATASMFSAWLGFVVGDAAAAQQHGADTVGLATKHGFRLLAAAGMVFEGWGLAHGGDPAQGAARAREGLAAFESMGTPVGQSLLRIVVAQADHLAGRHDEAMATLRHLIEGRGSGESRHYFDAELHRLMAEFLVARGPDTATEALDHLRRSLDIARGQGARTLELRTLAALGERAAEDSQTAAS